MTPSEICRNISDIKKEIGSEISLIAVSKTFSADLIRFAYDCGHRDFGENYVQEWLEKKDHLPGDIRWHFIGHLQTNKVKYLIPGIYMIHSVDSEKLLKEIIKQAHRKSAKTNVLLQVHISEEKTKFGFRSEELFQLFEKKSFLSDPMVEICGLMGMASFTDDKKKIKNEFEHLKKLFTELKEKYGTFLKNFNTLSMGMSADYKIAIEEGSNMIRIGSAIFGIRNYGNKT